MNGQIILLRLTDGTDVIGKQISSKRDGVQLENALEIIKGQLMGSGDPFLYFSKYFPYTKDFDVFIPKHHIVSISEEPLNNLMKYYDWFLNKIKKHWEKTAEEEFSMILKKLQYLDNIQEKDSEPLDFPPLAGKHQIH